MNRLQIRIQNAVRGYIIGDALGVPYEFKRQGEFAPMAFEGFGTHSLQPAGTWSDDSSIMLATLDAVNRSKEDYTLRRLTMDNLIKWYDGKGFKNSVTVFDIGSQTAQAIGSDFENPDFEGLGNGAMFYSLPLAIYNINQEDPIVRRNSFATVCALTHPNEKAISYGFKMSEKLRDSLLGDTIGNIIYPSIENRGDVINTFGFVTKEFVTERQSKCIVNSLLNIIAKGNDTDTNAAFLGALLGCENKVEKSDWAKIQKRSIADTIVGNTLKIFR